LSKPKDSAVVSRLLISEFDIENGLETFGPNRGDSRKYSGELQPLFYTLSPNHKPARSDCENIIETLINNFLGYLPKKAQLEICFI
jgi:hypothetical protein